MSRTVSSSRCEAIIDTGAADHLTSIAENEMAIIPMSSVIVMINLGAANRSIMLI